MRSGISAKNTIVSPQFHAGGRYEPFQVPVQEIENKTKLNFGVLRQYDPLENGANESFFESGTGAVPIKSLDNIIM